MTHGRLLCSIPIFSRMDSESWTLLFNHSFSFGKKPPERPPTGSAIPFTVPKFDLFQDHSQPQQMMAEERHIVDEAYAGDIIGVFDPGIFSIGDTICKSNKKFAFEGIPTFAPEHFARVRQIDTMKRKQFIKGINQIAQEGAIQIFQEFNTGMEEIIVGVVGVLQFEVLEYRLKNEYGVDIRLEPLPYEHIRWIENPEEIDVNRIVGTSDMKKIKDLKGNPLLVFANSWSVNMVLERNEGLKLSEFGRN